MCVECRKDELKPIFKAGRCQEHYEKVITNQQRKPKNREAVARRYHARIDAGLCTLCKSGQEKPLFKGGRCEQHYAALLEQQGKRRTQKKVDNP